MAKNESQETLDLHKITRFYRVFGKHYGQHLGILVMAFASMLVGIGVSLALPWTLSLLLDILANEPLPVAVSTWAPWALEDPTLAAAGLLSAYVLIKILIALFTFLDKYYVSVVGERMVADIRARIFAHLQRLSLSFHTGSESGDVIFRMTKDVKDIKKLLVTIPQDLLHRLFTILGFGGVLMWMNWKLAILAIIIIPTMYRFTKDAGEGVHKAEKKKKKKESKVATIVSESMRNMPIIQAFGRESSERVDFVKHNQGSLDADLTSIRIASRFKRFMDVIVSAATAGVLYVGGRYVLDGDLTLGTLYIFFKYSEDLYGPLDKLSESIVSLAKHQVAGERTLELIENDMVVRDRPGAQPAPAIAGHVEFRDVSFGYKSGETVLSNLNLNVEPGQSVAIVGHSGAGKSTLVSLLLRFFDPDTGSVRIDGTDIRDFQLKSIRSQITVLLQDALLLRKSVRENISFGKPDASHEEIVDVATRAEAREFIEAMPDGYDTLISENGSNVSGGQRQRLSIARAMLCNAPILILDEPTTGLDAQTAADLSSAMRHLVDGRTTFIIAHNLATIRNADKILLIEHGRILHQGTHEELIEASPEYRELHELQQGGTAA